MTSELFKEERIKKISAGDSSLDALLARLKQSMVTCDEYGKFVKKKAAQTEDYYAGLRKQARTTAEHITSSGSSFRQDSFLRAFLQIVAFDDRLYSVGHLYVTALLVMSDELHALVVAIGKSRKTIKEEGKRRERECIDAIGAAEKARQRYVSLCGELEKVRTTDPNKKSFSLSNKTNQQQDEELTRKIEVADTEYRTRAATCASLKQELVTHHRPNHAARLTTLILEIDIATSIQVQKYVVWQETLVMNLGVLISPVGGKASMKLVAAAVDNERDLYNYLLKFEKMAVNANLVPVEYRVHPSLASRQSPTKFFKEPTPASGATTMAPMATVPVSASATTSAPSPAAAFGGASEYRLTLDPEGQAFAVTPLRPLESRRDPTFGLTLGQVVAKAGNENVPLLVERCVQLIDAYGLRLDGLYRISGNAATLRQLREMIDESPTNYLQVGASMALDGSSTPSDSEVHLVALVLKSFFASLAAPVISEDLYTLLLDALKSAPDPTFLMRKFHQIVYKLADPEYFTLRYIVFHLNRVAAHQEENRMTARNLGIIWGTTLLPSLNANAEEMSFQGKIVEELMRVAGDIFEPDE